MRVVLLLLALLASGCIDLEVARFASVRAHAVAAGGAAPAPDGRGRSCVGLVVIFPVTALPNLGDALASASGGGTLSDVVVRYELRYVPFIAGRGCYVVEGTPR